MIFTEFLAQTHCISMVYTLEFYISTNLLDLSTDTYTMETFYIPHFLGLAPT